MWRVSREDRGEYWTATDLVQVRTGSAMAELAAGAERVTRLRMQALRSGQEFVWKILADVLPLLRNLEWFIVAHCGLQAGDAVPLFRGLHGLPRLTHVIAEGNSFGDNGREALRDLLAANWSVWCAYPEYLSSVRIPDRPWFHRSPGQFAGRPWFALVPLARMLAQLGRQLGLPRGVLIECWLASRPADTLNGRFCGTSGDWLIRAHRLLERVHVRDPVYRPRGCAWEADLMTGAYA